MFERIAGTLSTLVNEEYVTYDVQLDLEVAQLWGQGGLEGAAISKVSLAPGSERTRWQPLHLEVYISRPETPGCWAPRSLWNAAGRMIRHAKSP